MGNFIVRYFQVRVNIRNAEKLVDKMAVVETKDLTEKKYAHKEKYSLKTLNNTKWTSDLTDKEIQI